MIVTLTANPSLDRAVTLAATLRPGEVQAALTAREDAGGKGINVSRVIASAGVATLAILPLGSNDPFAAALHGSRIPIRTVPITGHARANTTITDPDGVTTKLNLPGAALSVGERDAVIAAVVDASAGADWLVLAGSLPPGASDTFYVDIIAAVRQAHGEHAPRIAVDTSGPALHAVVTQASPDLIKPNDEELAELAGAELAPELDLAAAAAALARQLVPARVKAALVTLGGAGAVLVNASGAVFASPPPITVVSTVGAGDSSLAGYLLAEIAGETASGCVANAVRYGSAAASLPGTLAPTSSDLPVGEIHVSSIDPLAGAVA